MLAVGRREKGSHFRNPLRQWERVNPGSTNLRVFRIELVRQVDLLAGSRVAGVHFRKFRKKQARERIAGVELIRVENGLLHFPWLSFAQQNLAFQSKQRGCTRASLRGGFRRIH